MNEPESDVFEPSFFGFRSAENLYSALADQIAARLTAGVARNGRASLVLSGGTTPGPLYALLAQKNLPWSNVWITLSDERWTDPSSPRSNENLARRTLLHDRAAAAHFVPLKTPAALARDAEQDVDAAIAAMPRPFDVTLLGMGTDLHTASLLPDAAGLAQALDCSSPALVRALSPSNVAALGERMTLTLRAIMDSRWIALLIRGEEKLAAYKTALQGGEDILSAPVRAVLRQSSGPVSVYWSA
jgi:6-phosphogluconolactonase